MNLETANRLVEYRKKHNLSQEEVAEKIGVSRQAVSKWERVEASPDTDNLIALAHLYNVSLDELVFGKKSEAEEEVSRASESSDQTAEDTPDGETAEEKRVLISEDGTVTVTRGKKTVVVDTKGLGTLMEGLHIHVNKEGDDEEDEEEDEHEEDEDCEDCKKGVKISVNIGDGKKPKTVAHTFFLTFPFYLIPTALYVWFGIADICGGWAFGWLVFFSVPLYYTLIEAIFLRRPDVFAFPILVTLFYLWYGIFMGPWHPTWMVFLTIPIYYFTCEMIRKMVKNSKEALKKAEEEAAAAKEGTK